MRTFEDDTRFTPLKSPMKLDIMLGDRYYTTIKVPVTVGLEYDCKDLRTIARMKLPSLQGKDFNAIPTAQGTFRI